MQHYYELQDLALKDTWLSVGSYDGVHLGHRQIIARLTKGARSAGKKAVVLTFYPHPATVLRSQPAAFYLSTPQEKAGLLSELGVEVVITHPFNLEVSQISAKDFVTRLFQHLGFEKMFIGHDFTLGHKREGNSKKLEEFGNEMGFVVEEVEAFEMEGKLVSSSRIRQLLRDGNVEEAAVLLSRPYSVNGEVERGEGRGRTIGIPTANLIISEERLIPCSGVYTSRVILDGKEWEAVTNIGVRPTFGEEQTHPQVETHILDFDQDIYGKTLELSFITRLRSEQKFGGVEELVAQIKADIEQARRMFSGS